MRICMYIVNFTQLFILRYSNVLVAEYPFYKSTRFAPSKSKHEPWPEHHFMIERGIAYICRFSMYIT